MIAALAALQCALTVRAALAQDSHAHAHAPLEIDAMLDWPALIDATLAAHPSSAELVARQAEAEAWRRRGQQWLAAAPSLYFSYLSDRRLDAVGQRQYDAGVELPLWRAGQRSAVQAVAESASAAGAAAAAALRLEVAGLLRGALWDIEAAANELAAAGAEVEIAAELARVVERRNARGDLPQADVLLAQNTLLETQRAAIEAEALRVDAERGYRSLTGLDRRPADFSEPRTAADGLMPSHPLIALADAAIERARAERALVERDARGPLTVTVGPHREYDALGTVPRDSLSLAVKVPVGGQLQGLPHTAAAATLVAAAQAERAQLLRRLDLDLHEAEHTLLVIDESAVLAAERGDVAERQLRMAQSAFAQGEIELRDLLRVQESTLAARRDILRLEIERRRTIAAFNQALGETP